MRMRGMRGTALLCITLMLSKLNVVAKSEEVVTNEVISEVLDNSNDNQHVDDVDVFNSDVIIKEVQIDKSEEEKEVNLGQEEVEDAEGLIDESANELNNKDSEESSNEEGSSTQYRNVIVKEEEATAVMTDNESETLSNEQISSTVYRNVVVNQEEATAAMADDDSITKNNEEETSNNEEGSSTQYRNVVVNEEEATGLMTDEESINEDEGSSSTQYRQYRDVVVNKEEATAAMTNDDVANNEKTVKNDVENDNSNELKDVTEEENTEITAEELNADFVEEEESSDDEFPHPSDMTEEEMAQLEVDVMQMAAANNAEDIILEESTNNEVDELTSVEIDNDGGITDKNIVSSPASSINLEDMEEYKTQTIEKTKNYKIMTEKIKKVVDRYEELERRQQALHDKILNYNKNQLQNFPFPIIHPNTTDLETQYVTKQEVLDKYGNWEEGLLNSSMNLYTTQISQQSKSKCGQELPSHTDLIQLINTHLRTYNPQFPPQNEQIRILYLNSHTTNTYTPPSTSSNKIPPYIYHSLHLKASVPSPSIIFSSHPLHPFSCWPLQGTNGAISFQLPKPILFTGLTILHSPQDVVSAPYHIKVYDDSNKNEDGDDILLIDSHFNPANNYIKLFNASSFSDDDDFDDIFEDEFDNNDIDEQVTTTSDALQQEFTSEVGGASCSEVTHSCSMPPPATSTTSTTTKEKQISEPKPVKKMTFYFDNNWGNPHYTCIYRLIIHGRYLSD